MTPDRFSERAALAAGLSGIALEWLGANWDIAWHGDLGRDRFLTPPHVLILAGIGLLVLAGVVGRRRGILLAGACGVLQLGTLAVDNWWHNTFGVDVSLWSPPHLLLIALGCIAMVGLLTVHRNVIWLGLLVADASILLAEYDFGFPHYRLAWSAMLLAAIALAGYSASAAILAGRWPATTTALAALGWRLSAVALNMLVHRSIPVPPLGLLGGAVVFDLLRRRRSWLTTTLVAWLAIVVVELPWLRLAGKTWWPSTLLPQVIVLGTVAALGGALLGGSVGRARAAWRPVVVAIGAPTLLLLPLLGHGSVVPVRDHWPTRTATVSFTGRVVSLTVDRAESTDWISLFRQSGRPGQPSRWVGGATWHGHGVFEGSVKSSPFAVGIWFVSGDQVYGNRVALGSTSHEVSLYRVTSARSQPPPRWARPAVSIVLAAVLLLALALASRLLVPEPDPVVTAERLSR